jgi:hypothetical protein
MLLAKRPSIIMFLFRSSSNGANMPELSIKPKRRLPVGNRLGEDLQFALEHWETDQDELVSIHETIGRLSHLVAARAAFAAMVQQRPNARILLRQASRVVMDSLRDRYGRGDRIAPTP